MEQINSLLKKNEKLAPATQIVQQHVQMMPNATVEHGLRFYKMANLMAQQFPEAQWVVDRLIPEGITVMSAAPMSFKTWLLLSIASSVAAGSKLFGQFDAQQSGVLMIDEEDSARMIQQRLKMLGAESSIPIYFMIGQGFKLDDTQIAKVIRLCKENDIRLLTIDSLVRVHNAKENDAVEMAEVFSKLRRFTSNGINVLITHHNRKGKSESPGEDMRGSSDIFAAVDCNLAVTRDGRDIVVKQVKLRVAEEIGTVGIEVQATDDTMELKFLEIAGPTRSKRVEVMSVIEEMLGEQAEMNQKQILETLADNEYKINAKTLRGALQKMSARKTIVTTPGKGKEIIYRLA